MQKVKIHSVIDLMTNSSTTVYTYSDHSAKAFEELADEILKTMGLTERCHDIFNVSVQVDQDGLADYISDQIYDDPEGVPEEYRIQPYWKTIQLLQDDIRAGKVEKPDWYKSFEEQYSEHENYSGYTPQTFLEVSAKDPKYDGIAKLMVDFLYSTSHEGF
jgi:hypothetical protein